jgi:hypothetical protein
MKILLYPILASITGIACNNGRTEKQVPGTITIASNNPDTTKLDNFPGTSVYIQLPDSFSWSETAMGFYKEGDGSVLKHDVFKTMRYAAKMPVGETMGTLTKKEPITISGYKGELKTYVLGSTGIQMELSFGDNTFMEFIEATCFSYREKTEKDILTALNSIQIKKK